MHMKKNQIMQKFFSLTCIYLELYITIDALLSIGFHCFKFLMTALKQ